MLLFWFHNYYKQTVCDFLQNIANIAHVNLDQFYFRIVRKNTSYLNIQTEVLLKVFVENIFKLFTN